MEKYHKTEILNVLGKARDSNKTYWVKYNPDGTVDLCSTQKDHPDYVKKVTAKKAEEKKANKIRREAEMKAKRVAKLRAKLVAEGVVVPA